MSATLENPSAYVSRLEALRERNPSARKWALCFF